MKYAYIILVGVIFVFTIINNTNITLLDNSTGWFKTTIYNGSNRLCEYPAYIEFHQDYHTVDGLIDYSLTKIPYRPSGNYIGSSA